MDPNEIKGCLNQLLHNNSLTIRQKESVKIAIKAIDVVVTISPHFYKAKKEAKDSNSDPNTGWSG